MTWEIVVGIITLLTACIAICTIVANNTRVMTEVKCSLDELNRSMVKQNATTDAHTVTLNNHEQRIMLLEKWEEDETSHD